MFKWFEDLEDGLFTGSRAMGPPWGPILRVVRYPAALIRDWLRGEISVRAMSLAYTTLLSVVPLLVFSFSILKGLGARGDLKFILDQFFAPLGAASAQLTESVMQFVTNMRGDLLGTIGLAFLVYTVVTTIQKVETSFNFLWRVDRPRSFVRRFTEYLSVMILGPILLAVALGLLASAERSPFAQWVDTIEPLAWILGGTGKVLPYLIVTVIFTFMYVFIPNTKVELRAALIGGITSGIVWALVGKAFTAFIVYSSSLVAIYTGFAIVLTTLIWVYLSWLILLIGAQLAFYLQFPQYLRHGQESFELTGRDREQVALSVMYLIGRDYAAGKTAWTGRGLAAELDMPSIALAPVLHGLEQSGLILATEDGHFVPGKDIGSIQLAEIFEVIRVLHRGRLAIETHGVAAAVALLREVESAMQEPLRDRSLKDFIAAKT
ncbi:MAG TPA: YihY/virulence factor BrkB family protein [Steroidobacteraceae bacterium]|nr:YihY/virulence factor BrkB family protein [Steroidobacteraceae bacterium]